ncbi:MAG: hypothetical protein ABI551_05950 [Polyangiaceae bacterium]
MIEKFISLRTLVLTAAVATAACSSSSSANNAAPIIDDFEAPGSVTADASGTYTITAKFSAHDDASAITAIGVRATGLQDNPIATDSQHRYVNQPFTLKVTGAPKGTVAYTFYVNAADGTSASQQETIELQ